MKLKSILKVIDNYNKSYSHKPHLQDLPYDLRTNNPKLLQERLDEIENRLFEEEETLSVLQEIRLKIEDEKTTYEKKIKELEELIIKYENEQEENEQAINENLLKIQEAGDEINNEIIKDTEKWEEYVQRFRNHDEDFVSYRWNESTLRSMEKQINDFQKEITILNNTDFTKATTQDYENLEDLSHNLTSFIKDHYDHQTEGMEYNVWFPYGSLFGNARNSIGSNKETASEITRLETKNDSLAQSTDYFNRELDRYTTKLNEVEEEINDYLASEKEQQMIIDDYENEHTRTSNKIEEIQQ